MASIQRGTDGRWAVRWRDDNDQQPWQTVQTKTEATTHLQAVELGIALPSRGTTKSTASPTLGEYSQTWTSRQI